ncbi:MAG: hypothetical protein L6R41_004792 [Letrouitia leprolyta]|nr:MAG: hypothetical protein L6R41_004792 [Letrouitia leprolyta]
MIDSKGHGDVFNGILEVLQRIEAQLQTHEQRVKQVEDLVQKTRLKSIEDPDSSSWTSTDASSVSWQRLPDDKLILQRRPSNLQDNLSISGIHHAKSGFEATSEYSKSGPKMRYGAWRPESYTDTIDDLTGEISQDLLEKFLGHCANMPDDGRLPLSFDWTVNHVLPGISRFGDLLPEAQRLETLCAFDKDLRAQPGNDFLVVDFDTYNRSRIYRVGQKAIGDELMVSSESPRDAPWSRLVYDMRNHDLRRP